MSALGNSFGRATMIGSALLLLAAAAIPCDTLATLTFPDAVITAATVVAEGPAPARGSGPGGARGAAPPAARSGAPPANIPAHCRVQLTLKPSSDSVINMELWLPLQNWNGKFLGAGNGGFAGSIQG